jgi:hypothetical protein
MNETQSSAEFFRALAKMLLRCWILGFIVLLIWVGALLLTGDLIHRLHGGMFGLSKHELELIFYGGMGLLKLLVLVFFFIPWLAIRLMLRNEKT